MALKELSKAEIEEFERIAADAVERRGKVFRNNTAYSIYPLRDSDKIERGSAACHAHLSRMFMKKCDIGINYFQFTHSGWMTEPGGHEARVAILNYRYNQSPWADCFVGKDPEVCLERGYEIIRLDSPGLLCAGAHTSVRCMWEVGHQTKNFIHLIDAGINPNLAFALSYVNKMGNYPFRDGHSTLAPSTWDIKTLTNFVNNTPVNEVGPPMNVNPVLYGHSHLWTTAKRDRNRLPYYINKIRNQFKDKIVNTMDGVAVNNPFLNKDEVYAAKENSSNYIKELVLVGKEMHNMILPKEKLE